ncbi:MAG: hypothetical protein ABI563_13730 [Specibacter sp.]
MNIQDWWPLLDPSTRQWLINNNGDMVPPSILAQIKAVAGEAAADASCVGDDGPEGFSLSDEAIDWVEQAANDEDFGSE